MCRRSRQKAPTKWRMSGSLRIETSAGVRKKRRVALREATAQDMLRNRAFVGRSSCERQIDPSSPDIDAAPFARFPIPPDGSAATPREPFSRRARTWGDNSSPSASTLALRWSFSRTRSNQLRTRPGKRNTRTLSTRTRVLRLGGDSRHSMLNASLRRPSLFTHHRRPPSSAGDSAKTRARRGSNRGALLTVASAFRKRHRRCRRGSSTVVEGVRV